ncbi:MAG: Gfo/Idh/MocA family oxidoreductase [Desulfobacterales bacterium]|nr:Gfo/Idh/MocA family oxidoreductase [Desulfobacterales bacterium]
MEKINVGIIGCGRISDLHYPGYRQSDQARIHAVCDTDTDLAQRRTQEWGADTVYTDYREMLCDKNIDAVEILTPHKLHEAMVVDAARAGKHISLQKPMTIDLESADRMLAAVAEAGVVFRISDNYVFYPPIVQAKKLIEDGAIGKPTNLRIKMISGSSGGWEVPAASWDWRLAENAAGRGFQTFDHGHHLWTTAWYLLGEVERVSAWIDSADGIVDSPATIMWKYSRGVCYGMCEYAYASDMHIPSKYYANDEWIEVTGTRGILLIRRCTGDICTGPGLRLFDGHNWTDYADVATDWAEGFLGATHNFIAAIRGEAPPLLSGVQGREMLRLTVAISKSARVRREVYPDELDARFPWLFTWQKIRKEKKDASPGFSVGALLGFGKKEAVYADQAGELTEKLAERFDPAAVRGWYAVVGLHLTAQGNSPELRFHLTVSEDHAQISKGQWPDEAELVIRVPAGTWAAILMGKKRIETALIQGQLKLSGKAEHGLKLRDAFHI